MQQTTQPIAVLGASGAQGGAVVQALLHAGRPVRAIARTLSRLQPLAEQGAEIVALDLTNTEALKRAFDGVAGAFVHFPVLPVVKEIEAQAHSVVEALRQANVPLVVFTTSGPVPTTFTGSVFDMRLAAERVMSASNLPLITFRMLIYLENLMTPGMIEASELRCPLPAELRLPWVSIEDQAQLAVAALARPDLAGRSFAIGEAFTGPELAEEIGRGIGRPLRYVPVEPQAFGASVAPFMGEQFGALLAQFYHLLGSRAPFLVLDQETESVRRELGIQTTPLSVWASQRL